MRKLSGDDMMARGLGRAADSVMLRQAARIAELEAAIVAMHRSVPGGTVCDPQVIADELRAIAKLAGVDVGAH